MISKYARGRHGLIGLGVLFGLTCSLHAALHLLKGQGGGALLDLRWTESGARDLLETLQADAVALAFTRDMLVPIDTAYAVAYGVYVAGLCWRYAPEGAGWTAAIPLSAMLFDFGENAIHWTALSGVEGVLAVKTVFTTPKFILVGTGSALATWFWVRTVFGRLSPSRG